MNLTGKRYSMDNGDTLKIRDGFTSLAGKTGEKPLTIAYLGASNTALETGWRPVVQDWINRHIKPQGEHTEVNASIGGTDSLTGAFESSRMAEKNEPDLVFVEFSQPDSNNFVESRELLACSVEAIVRNIRTAAPGCDICFLYFLHKSLLREHRKGLTWSERIHERIASHYGIPSINVARHIIDLEDGGGMDIFPGGKGPSVLRADLVHPTEQGNAVISGHITDCLEKIIESVTAGTGKRELPPKLCRYDMDKWKNVPVTPEYIRGEFVIKKKKVSQAPDQISYYSIKKGGALEFRLRGVLAGFLSVTGPASGYVRCDIDGETARVKNLFNAYCFRDMLSATRMIKDASDIGRYDAGGYRAVSIKLLDGVPGDGSNRGTPGTEPPMPPEEWEFSPVSIFVIGDIQAVKG
ncbi:MAG: hypothetical protein GF392_06070 [Candidatus Omnitrophica bacterium]|nr:hypothetical protein [Candidatus Omnitrophota bacterium]